MFGKQKPNSLFNYFNNVNTRGGEILLEKMMASPLRTAVEVNRRSSAIKYIQNLKLEFTIDREVAHFAYLYIHEGVAEGLFLSMVSSFWEKGQEILYRSERYKAHESGIVAIHHVLSSAKSLLTQLSEGLDTFNDAVPPIIKHIHERLQKLMFIESFGTKTGSLTIWKVAKYRNIYRKTYLAELLELFEILHQLDVYISVAKTAAAKKLSYAEVLEEQTIFYAENIRHPYLYNGTGNKINFTNEKNMMFLTGANMAGKSTLMKTLGCSFYLAHIGFPVAADNMRVGLMDGIFTSINLPDDITQGWSHFYAEVMRIKQLAEKLSSGMRVFILLDELFKGTNVKDAYDATLAVAEKFTNFKECIFVVSTHIVEVGPALTNKAQIHFKYMPTDASGNKIRYSYCMKDGITVDRQGMQIIAQEKVLELLQ